MMGNIEKKILLAGMLCVVLVSSAGAAVVTDNLVSWWKLDETSGTTAADFQGSNNGTLTGGAAWTTDTPGSASSGALAFDGSNGVVNSGHDSSLNITGAMTIEAWVKPVNWTDAAPNGREQAAGRYDCYSLSYESWDTGSLEFRLDNDTNRVAYDTEFTDGNWHYIVGVYTGTQLLLYLDGQNVASMSYSSGIPASNTIDMTLGGNNPFNGKLDDVRVYSKALSVDEIAQNYAAIVPEPATMGLLLLGIPMALRRRKRQG